jgi:nitroimidazol reductase NimA-like FMN-containing flavoprotein (pyridoxamine 5'-phosphate oxidase superfamily)
MLEKLSAAAIEEQWRRARLVRVAVHSEGRTRVEPLAAAWVENGLIVGVTARQRAWVLRAAGRVCVQYDDAVDPNDWTSVIAWSRPTVLAGEADAAARRHLRDAVAWSRAISDAIDAIDATDVSVRDRDYSVLLLPLDDQTGRHQRSLPVAATMPTTRAGPKTLPAGQRWVQAVAMVLSVRDGATR